MRGERERGREKGWDLFLKNKIKSRNRRCRLSHLDNIMKFGNWTMLL